MTIWSPRIDDSSDPIYARIADALERDLQAGVILPGSQLPTHRQLAEHLGITTVTVTRAYGEAARRGLVESATGRGTFVRGLTRREPMPSTEIDLSTNVISVPLPPMPQYLLQRAGDVLAASSYGQNHERHRAAGAAFIGRRTDPSRVLVTSGAQHAMFLAFSATTKAGDAVMTESVTYHGAKNIAAMLHLRLEPLPLDRYGIVPDAFERACKARLSKVLYTVPSLHNPTGLVFSEKRRRELAAVAEKYGITIIEDDIVGFLIGKTPPPLAAFAPDRTIYLTGLAKLLVPGLRVGYMTAPEALFPKLQAGLAASILFTTPLLAEIAATWIEDGTVARVAAKKREEVELRNRIARRSVKTSSDARSPHLWVELPKRWTPDAFAEEARRRRIRVASATAFAVGEDVPRAVRLSIGAPVTTADLEHALQVLDAIGEARAAEPVV